LTRKSPCEVFGTQVTVMPILGGLHHQYVRISFSERTTILSIVKNGKRPGLPRRSTMICCRNTRISASNAARGRSRSTIIPKIILQRSNIPQKITRFCVSRQLDGIYDRDRRQKFQETDSWRPETTVQFRASDPHGRTHRI